MTRLSSNDCRTQTLIKHGFKSCNYSKNGLIIFVLLFCMECHFGMGMCCKKDNDWVKKCIQYEVEGARPRGKPKKTLRDCGKTVRHVN